MVRSLTHEKKFVLLVMSFLVLQTLGRYYSKPFLIWTSFDSLKFLLAFVVPIILGRLFIFHSLSEMGLGRPRLKRREWLALMAIFILIPLVITLINGNEGYLQYYQTYRQTQTPVSDRLQRFSLFALSTITGWELLHRGFFLNGVRKLLGEMRLSDKSAVLIAVLWVACLEVVYHFLKPDLETWGMIAFSPLASFLAIRAKSIWPGLVLHLWIEANFIIHVTGALS